MSLAAVEGDTAAVRRAQHMARHLINSTDPDDR
jgi:hypothetical protein